MNATLFASNVWDTVVNWVDKNSEASVQLAIIAGIVALAIMFSTRRKN